MLAVTFLLRLPTLINFVGAGFVSARCFIKKTTGRDETCPTDFSLIFAVIFDENGEHLLLLGCQADEGHAEPDFGELIADLAS